MCNSLKPEMGTFRIMKCRGLEYVCIKHLSSVVEAEIRHTGVCIVSDTSHVKTCDYGYIMIEE